LSKSSKCSLVFVNSKKTNNLIFEFTFVHNFAHLFIPSSVVVVVVVPSHIDFNDFTPSHLKVISTLKKKLYDEMTKKHWKDSNLQAKKVDYESLQARNNYFFLKKGSNYSQMSSSSVTGYYEMIFDTSCLEMHFPNWSVFWVHWGLVIGTVQDPPRWFTISTQFIRICTYR